MITARPPITPPHRNKLNTINFKKSMHYNPFAYIHPEKDILKLVTTLIANTKGEGKAGDDFWVKAGGFCAAAPLVGYLHDAVGGEKLSPPPPSVPPRWGGSGG